MFRSSITITIIILTILLERCPFSNTLKKLNYLQLTTATVKNKNADHTGSRSLRCHTSIFIAHKVLFRRMLNRLSGENKPEYFAVAGKIVGKRDHVGGEERCSQINL